jgi:PAS domain S-box-containing protein
VTSLQQRIPAAKSEAPLSLENLLESVPDAMLGTDQAGVIRFVNRQTESLFGYDRHTLVGQPVETLMPDSFRAAHVAHRAGYAAHPRTRTMGSGHDLTGRRRNGTEFPAEISLCTVETDAGLLVMAAVRDVSDRKDMERTLLEQNVALEGASRRKSEFLASMSHELRTPLNSVIGFSEALKDGLVGEVTEDQRAYLGDIFDSGQHLLSLINDILDLSKIEAGMMTFELEAVDVRQLLSNTLSIVREKAAANGIRLHLELDECLGITLLDVRKTKQIVYNLLSNAVKFSTHGGLVSLSARQVPRREVGTLEGTWPEHSFELAGNEFPEFLEIRVTDSGRGISQENMTKLFQAFTQIDSSQTRSFEGTGLGLAMVKQMTELMGGTVAVASKENEGTCFASWIPQRTSADPDSLQALGTREE